MAQQKIFERITIIGLGLIGSSIARAARERHLAGTIAGCDRNEVSLAYGRKHGFIDIGVTSAKEAAVDSDLVIIATPPSGLEAIAKKIASALKPGCIVMDVCSVKQTAIAAIAPHLPEGVHFIPAHPVAGSDSSGINAGRADLFGERRVIITPDEPDAIRPAIATAKEFWNALGARMEAMPAHLHDLVYAYVSHLPHLLAYAAGAVLEPGIAGQPPESEMLRKFLRLSNANIQMWTEIFLLNKDNLIMALNRYLDAVTHIEKELCEGPDAASAAAIPQQDAELARTALFPRVAASCLITTIMEAEKKAGFPFARFAGSGFADFTYPASLSPEGDIESISNQYQAVIAVLREYAEKLKAMSAALASGDIGDAL